MAPELPEALREVAERAVNVLAPETDLFEDMDSAGFGDALTKALRSAVTHPVKPARSAVHLATDFVKIPLVAGARWFGREVRAAGRGRPEGPPLRRAGLEHQPGVLLGPAGLSVRPRSSPGTSSNRPRWTPTPRRRRPWR